MAKFDMNAALRYLGLGVGAVALPAIAVSFTALDAILNNQALNFSLAGVTVKAVLLAGVGILAVDKTVFGN